MKSCSYSPVYIDDLNLKAGRPSLIETSCLWEVFTTDHADKITAEWNVAFYADNMIYMSRYVYKDVNVSIRYLMGSSSAVTVPGFESVSGYSRVSEATFKGPLPNFDHTNRLILRFEVNFDVTVKGADWAHPRSKYHTSRYLCYSDRLSIELQPYQTWGTTLGQPVYCKWDRYKS